MKILILEGYSGLFLRLEEAKIMFQILAHLPSYHQKILDRNDVPITDMCIEVTPMRKINTEELFFQTSRETTSVPFFFFRFSATHRILLSKSLLLTFKVKFYLVLKINFRKLTIFTIILSPLLLTFSFW